MRRWLVVLVAVVAAVTVPVGREVAGASPDTEYPAAVNGLGHLVHYWRFEDEPATYDDFADQVSAQGALALTRFPNSTVGVTGALAGGAPGKAFSVRRPSSHFGLQATANGSEEAPDPFAATMKASAPGPG